MIRDNGKGIALSLDDEFANINVDFQLSDKKHNQLIHNFKMKIKNNQRWVHLLDAENQLYAIRALKNRWFFYSRQQEKIILLEQVLLWDDLIKNTEVGIDAIANAYHVTSDLITECVAFYRENESSLALSNIQF